MTPRRSAFALAIGFAAGLLSGLLGVGGGVVIVPLAVGLLGLSQHRAHATSLASIIPIGVAGAIVFGIEGNIEIDIAFALAAGAVIGAPLGAGIAARIAERPLRVAFGLLMLVVGVVLWI